MPLPCIDYWPASTTIRTRCSVRTNTATTPSSGCLRPKATRSRRAHRRRALPVHPRRGRSVFAVAVPFTGSIDYRLEVSYDDGAVITVADPYRFLPSLGEVDLHLFSEGRHERLWEVLGAHPRSFTTPDGEVNGVSFAVWAPNAKGVSLIGDFNHWDGIEAPHAHARLHRGVGVVLARTSRPTGSTSSACTARTVWSPSGPTRWRSPPRCHPNEPRASPRATTRGATPTG